MSEMSEERLKLLVYKYLTDSLTEEESNELDAYGSEDPQVWLLIARLQDEDQLTSDLADIHEMDPKSALADAWKLIDKKGTPFYKRPFWRAAAIVIPIVAVTTMIVLQRRQHSPASKAAAFVTRTPAPDIRGGSYKAILTLAGGQQLDLLDQPKGNIAFQNGAKIVRTDSALSYIPVPLPYVESQQHTPPQYNILTTPRASQFSIVLPDGTKVWLNDSTRLYYPTFFSGPYREVALTGEAYFEVAKDPDHPFHIKVNDLIVNVLGTSFAIRAYRDEDNTTATLLKGKIAVLNGQREQVLDPNEQVSVSRQNQWQLRRNIDPDSVLAWKEGIFYFTHADIPTVMHELSKWYSVEVEIKVPATQYYYDGEFPRDVSLSAILNYMTNDDVHFIREGNKVIVTP
ncbi:MAG TPA: FecR domain-containing protein [Puia sp.]|nr:FecR domain-containing protein [Puia sp.]